ncbi:uncharacterized protein EDB91DRAFT_1035150, partial [Suillus paluster]|uniref:uncharacterized protein n=1 Tax=Suillus paluster TaxID=48578 RepID=UPI001B87F411
QKPASPAHFDVAFVVEDRELWEIGTGLDFTQIHAIFKLPSHYGHFSHLLTYIEWFRPLHEPQPMTKLYQLARST